MCLQRSGACVDKMPCLDQSWPSEQRQAMPKAEAIQNRAQALPQQPYQAPPQPYQAPPCPYQQSPAHATAGATPGVAEYSHVPPEPGMPAPQNPVVGGNSTPARSASPAAQHIFNQPPSVTTTPGGAQQATPALRKRGKRLVFSREPAKGQVVLPEHPVEFGRRLSTRNGDPQYKNNQVQKNQPRIVSNVCGNNSEIVGR